jgi:UDP-N-acetylmuramoyl-L-alanyl-D-glutamate--2,6-diaminopimelate ligase
VVFGCGGDRDAGKRPLMGEIAARLADWSIVTDDNPRSEDGAVIAQQIVSGMAGAKVSVLRDRRAAIREAIARSATADALLIAGKGHENYQEVAGTLLPFDDTEHARAALLERAA